MNERFGEGLQALVVDDDAVICDVLGRLLRDAGFVVDAAFNLSAARQSCAGTFYDLYLIDDHLGDGTGLDLARELRARSAESKIVLITGYATVDSAIDALRLQLDDYIQKPFTGKVVLARVRRVIAGLRLERQNRQLRDELAKKDELISRDSLTGLHNHAFLQEFVERELARAARNDLSCALVMVDVDGFKGINDTYGHPAGDAVLRRIAEVLAGRLTTDRAPFGLRGQDIAGRYGGDEFALVLPETSKAGGAVKAERLRAVVAACSWDDDRGPPRVTISAGVAAFPADGKDRQELFAAADVALYTAKHAGRNRIVTVTAELLEASHRRRRAASAELKRLRGVERTIEARRFTFCYQPIVEARGGALFGYEALCRPVDDQFAAPLELLETAQRAGQMAELGRVLRDAAVAPLDRLPAEQLLFVNVHPLELNERLVAWGRALGASARRIVLEIDDAGRIGPDARLTTLLQTLRQTGFGIALDHLRAGYDGLGALAALQPGYVKLDAKLLDGAREDGRVERLVRHLVEFARDEGVRVVGTGVETEAQRATASELGFDLLQGFFLGEPAPAFCAVKTRQHRSAG